jgi:hypothetical protein
LREIKTTTKAKVVSPLTKKENPKSRPQTIVFQQQQQSIPPTSLQYFLCVATTTMVMMMMKSLFLVATLMSTATLADRTASSSLRSLRSSTTKSSSNPKGGRRRQLKSNETTEWGGEFPEFDDDLFQNATSWLDDDVFQNASSLLDEFLMIDFDAIDWETVDWANFDWNSTDWMDHDWSQVLGQLISEAGLDELDVCSILQTVVGMSEELSIMGSCTCEGNITSGMSIECSFTDVCHHNTTAATSTTEEEIALIDETVAFCGSTEVQFQFDSLEALTTTVFVDFKDDRLSDMSYSFRLPLAGQWDDWTFAGGNTTECLAVYGPEEQECTCTVAHDTNTDSPTTSITRSSSSSGGGLCIAVDCSMYQEGAVMETCQNLDLRTSENGASLSDNAANFLPDFSTAVSTLAVEDPTGNAGGDGSVSGLEQEAGSGAGSVRHLVTMTTVALISIMVATM